MAVAHSTTHLTIASDVTATILKYLVQASPNWRHRKNCATFETNERESQSRGDKSVGQAISLLAESPALLTLAEKDRLFGKTKSEAGRIMKLITVILFAVASCLGAALLTTHSNASAIAYGAPAHAATLQGPPTGKIVLGDPSVSPAFGHDKKWGPVKNFDHGTHSQASYATSCEQCHHTNKNAKTEAVKKCSECHKEEGNEKNPSMPSGDEATIMDAFHGNPNNTSNNAGCITCHKKMGKGPTSCTDCHEKKG